MDTDFMTLEQQDEFNEYLHSEAATLFSNLDNDLIFDIMGEEYEEL